MKRLPFLALVALTACYSSQTSTCFTTPTPPIDPTATPSPSPTIAPGASPTATPTPDPCGGPVIGVRLDGPTSVDNGTQFKIDVTPVSSTGPLEGVLDFCNSGRFVVVENLSANLRCVGSCNGFGPQFLAQGVGPFSLTIRVEGASASFAGTVR